MKDGSARYLIIDACCINNIMYKYVKKGLFNYRYDLCNYFMASDIFEKNNIPEEYRRIIIKINIPFTFNYEAEEYITKFPFDITSGKIEKDNDKKIITVSNFYCLNKIYRNEINFKTELNYLSFDDINDFLQKLEENDFLKNYLKSLEEFFNGSLNMELSNDILRKKYKCKKLSKNKCN